MRPGFRRWTALLASGVMIAGLVGASAVAASSAAHASAPVAGPAEQTSCPDPGVLAGSHPTQVGLLQKAIADALPCAFTSTAWEPAGSNNLVVYLTPLNAHTRSVAQTIINETPIPKVTVSLKQGVQSYVRAEAQARAVAARFAGKVGAAVKSDGHVELDSDSVPEASLMAASHVAGYQAEPTVIHQHFALQPTAGGMQQDWEPGSAYTASGLGLVGAYDLGSCDGWVNPSTSTNRAACTSQTLASTVGATHMSSGYLGSSGDTLHPAAGAGPSATAYSGGDYVINGNLSMSRGTGYGQDWSYTADGQNSGAYVYNAMNLDNAWTVSGWFSIPDWSGTGSDPLTTISGTSYITSCDGGNVCSLLWSGPYGLDPYVDVGYYYKSVSGCTVCQNGLSVYAAKDISGTFTNIQQTISSPKLLQPGQRFFLTVTYDGATTVKIYVDGSLAVTETLNYALPSDGDTSSGSGSPYIDFAAVAHPQSAISDSDATMSHVALFSTELNSTQVTNLWDAENAGTVGCSSTDYTTGPSGVTVAAPRCKGEDVAGTEFSTWTGTSSSDITEYCTEGWALTDSSQTIYRESDGHCAGDNSSHSTTNYGNNSTYTSPLGHSGGEYQNITCYWCMNQTTTAPSGYSQTATEYDWPADLLLMNTNSWDGDAGAGYFYDGNAIQGVTYGTSLPASSGQTIFKYGIDSGWGTGTISSLTYSYCDQQNLVMCFPNEIESTDMYPTLGMGDSGGPVWAANASDGKYIAIGTNEAVGTGITVYNNESNIESWTSKWLVTCGC